MIEETPARRSLQLSSDVFFFNPRNRERVRGLSTPLEIASPHTIGDQLLVASIITVIIAAITSIILPHLVWLILPVTGIIIFGQSHLIVAQANARINKRLAKGGEFVMGESVSCVGGLSRQGRSAEFQVTATFTFLTPNRTQLWRTDKQVRPHLDGKPLPVPGTPVVVLYFSDTEMYLL
jgi:hypothetical protein